MAKIIPPKIKEIDQLELKRPNEVILQNGIPLYDVRLGTEDVLKIELVFHCGRPYEHKKLVSRLTGQLLKEGTNSLSGPELAETFDFYGATFSTPVNLDFSSIIIFTLKKYFHKLLPILVDLLENPAFPQRELNSIIKRNKQKLALDQSKNDVVAYRTVTERIFGPDHHYGYNSSVEYFEDITREDIIKHFNDFYGSTHCQIFISGKTDDQIIKDLDATVGQVLQAKPIFPIHNCPIPEHPSPLHIAREDSWQSAIRIGRRLFNRNHPDFNGMFVLNTILGGFFGSRLMNTIREEKGYTYNIFSMVDPMRFDGFFYVGTEVGKEHVTAALHDIYDEMDKLKQEPVGEEELLMVKRYLKGNMLTMLDGPFNVAEIMRTLIGEGSSLDHFDELVHTIKTIQPAELQSIAQKYFDKDSMWEVVVG